MVTHHFQLPQYLETLEILQEVTTPNLFWLQIVRTTPTPSSWVILALMSWVKTLLWVFSAIDNLRNVKLHHIDNSPNMSLWDDFRQNRRPKVFSEKIAIFPTLIPVENVKTLKTWLWLFSAIDNLRNVKLHHIDYGPNMSLWVDFRQNRRPKVFSE